MGKASNNEGSDKLLAGRAFEDEQVRVSRHAGGAGARAFLPNAGADEQSATLQPVDAAVGFLAAGESTGPRRPGARWDADEPGTGAGAAPQFPAGPSRIRRCGLIRRDPSEATCFQAGSPGTGPFPSPLPGPPPDHEARRNLASRIPNLQQSLRSADDGKPFLYAGYLSGKFLDERVDSERTSFDIAEEADGQGLSPSPGLGLVAAGAAAQPGIAPPALFRQARGGDHPNGARAATKYTARMTLPRASQRSE